MGACALPNTAERVGGERGKALVIQDHPHVKAEHRQHIPHRPTERLSGHWQRRRVCLFASCIHGTVVTPQLKDCVITCEAGRPHYHSCTIYGLVSLITMTSSTHEKHAGKQPQHSAIFFVAYPICNPHARPLLGPAVFLQECWRPCCWCWMKHAASVCPARGCPAACCKMQAAGLL